MTCLHYSDYRKEDYDRGVDVSRYWLGGGAAAEAPRGNLWPQNEAKLVMHVEMDTKSL